MLNVFRSPFCFVPQRSRHILRRGRSTTSSWADGHQQPDPPLSVGQFRTQFGRCTFSVCSSDTWNSLYLIRLIDSHAAFRRALDTSLPHALDCGRLCFWRRRSVEFCLCVKYLGNRWTDLRQIHTEDVFDPSLGRVWRSGQRSKLTGTKNSIFRPFRRPVCCLCLVKHL